ncbi:MAG: ABC transporter ATP-binding protein [Propionibacteriaceae bacterium]|nr:ABC transporter ATP-binding protein [Propionibacteriaceae bacterium]
MTETYLDARVVIHRGGFTLDVTLQLPPGTRLAMLGPNGAGKSTLLAGLAGHLRLTNGHIKLDGRTLDDGRRQLLPPHLRSVVLLGQDPLVFPHLSVGRNVAYGLLAHGVGRADAEAQAAVLMKRLGLSKLCDSPGNALSGGQRQRVALARALAVQPALLLLDEPFSSLDVDSAAQLRAVTAELLRERGATSLVVSHDILDVAALADQIAILDDGHVVDHGPIGAVLGEPCSPFAAMLGGIGVLQGRLADGYCHMPGDWAVPCGNTGLTGDVTMFVPPDAVTLTPGGPLEVSSVTAAPAGLAVTLGDGTRLFVATHWAVEPWLKPGASVSVSVDHGKIRLIRRRLSPPTG